MASPVDAGRVVTNLTATRPSTINLPTGIQAGDLLVIAGRGGGTVTMLLPAGWSWLVQNDGADASDDTVSIIYKYATGSEGTTLTWDLGFAIKGCAIAWRIQGAADPATRAPEVVAASFAAVANTADPPVITPTGGSKDYLFLVIAGKDGVQTFTAAPAGYTNFIAGAGSSGGQAATNANAAGASKQATTTTDNPGAFTHGAATNGGRVFTIAIHPAPPPAPPDNETIIDDFNRADGQLDAGAGAAIWTQTYYDNSARTDLRVSTNRLADGVANWQSAYTKIQLEASFDLLIDCVVAPVAPNFEFGMFFSITDPGTSGFDGYGLFWGNGSWFMRRYTNAVNQGNIATGTGPLLAGDTLWVRKRGSDIKVYRRPSGGEYGLLMSATDATYGVGVVVLELSDTTQRWDNLRGGPRVAPKYYGALSLPITFGKDVAGIRIPLSLYKNAVVADGPAAYWRFDEVSGNALPVVGSLTLSDNATGGGTTGLLLNEPTSMGRRFISANTGHLSGGSQPFKYNVFSWEIWAKRTRNNVYEILADQYNGGYRLSLGSDGALNLEASYGGIIARAAGLKINDTNSHHIVVTRNGIGGEVVFYLDGVAEIGVPGSSVSHDISGWPNYAIFVGSSWGNSPFDGTLDEFAVYSKVISQAQVTNHYDIATHVATTVYGSLAFSVSFSKDVQGQRKTFGQVALPVLFSKDVRGQRKTFGQVSKSFIFSKDVSGQRKTFGQIVFPINASISIAGDVKGNTIFGVLSLPIIFSKDVRGQRKTFGQVARPITFSKDVRGFKKTFSNIALPINVSIATAGIIRGTKKFGALSLPIIFTKDVIGRKKMYGQITRPFLFDSVIQGRRLRFGSISFPLYFAVKVNFGQVGVHSAFSLPITADITTAGKRTHGAIILNEAVNLYLGERDVSAIYIGSEKVWPSYKRNGD